MSGQGFKARSVWLQRLYTFNHLNISHSRTQPLGKTWNLLINTLTLLPPWISASCLPFHMALFLSFNCPEFQALMCLGFIALGFKEVVVSISGILLFWVRWIWLRLQEVCLLPEQWSLSLYQVDILIPCSAISSYPSGELGMLLLVCLGKWQTHLAGTVPLPLTSSLICTPEDVNF